ncbi:MAG: xanthine dehydrogenase family protein subunit M [Syntrophobacteraceae bacterium]|jgi:carbon-monoxide dehydrogenase medium subunit
MRPAEFEYFAPRTVDEALGLLERYGEGARVLAGGLSLVPMMKLRLTEPQCIIDISKIPGLSYVIQNNGSGLKVGSLTTYHALQTSAAVKSSCPILSVAASNIGDTQIRNRGTIGGNICHADPACDLTAVTLAVGAELKAIGPGGARTIKSDDFFVDLFTSALKHGELLTEIAIPSYLPGTGDAYHKLTQRSGDFAIVSVAVVMTLGDGDVCQSASVVLGSVGPTPIRSKKAEKALKGKSITDKLIDEASDLASREIDPSSDVHSSAEYKKEMSKVITQKALKEAFLKARGGK